MAETEKDDVQGLLAKRDELLREVKNLKGRVAELEGERDAANGRADNAEGEVQRVRLDEPVAAVLGDMFAVKLKYVLPDVQEHFSFNLGDDGQVQFTAKDGARVKVGEAGKEREAGFNSDDVRAALEAHGGFDDVLLTRAKGGTGKPPSAGQNGVMTGDAPKSQKVAPEFGLR
ncbi:hypothetical protein [Roseovarius sp. D0-M9]|uniref:hypothetical protein n=1 Tax=Roseovarius sp. D0-M9 TaxID=3127117 RepID=UPI00300FD684